LLIYYIAFSLSCDHFAYIATNMQSIVTEVIINKCVVRSTIGCLSANSRASCLISCRLPLKRN